MTTSQRATRMVVFLAEDDRADGRPLGDELLARARHAGLVGATLWRGIEGCGASGRLRSARFPDALNGLPLVLEIVDRPESIDGFLEVVLDLAPSALVTREQVQVLRPAP